MVQPLRIVRVEWEDASVVDEGPWVDRATMAAPHAITFFQVGFLLSLTAKEVVLTHAVGEQLLATRERIPAGMIRSIVELQPGAVVPRPRRKRTVKQP